MRFRIFLLSVAMLIVFVVERSSSRRPLDNGVSCFGAGCAVGDHIYLAENFWLQYREVQARLIQSEKMGELVRKLIQRMG